MVDPPSIVSVRWLTNVQYLITETTYCVGILTIRMMKEIAKKSWMMLKPSSLVSRKRRYMINWEILLRPRQLEVDVEADCMTMYNNIKNVSNRQPY
jgi:hypothetical protein